MPYKTINDDVELYYEIYGPEDAPPIVFLEGWGYSLWMWFRQIPVLKGKYRCIVFDNRGVGRSSKPDYPYTMKMFADDTVALMNALGIEKAHFLGISMGGYIAQQIAISYPEVVRSLILVSTSYGGPNAVSSTDRTQMMMFAIPTETLSNEQAMEMRYSVILSDEFRRENKLLINQIQSWREQIPQPLKARGNQAAATISFNLEEEVKGIKVPTLVMHGDSDLVMPPENGELLAKNIPSSKLVFIKGGLHLSFIEYYEKFNEQVITFIDEVENGKFSPKSEKLVI